MNKKYLPRLLPCLLLAGAVALHADDQTEKKQIIIRKSEMKTEAPLKRLDVTVKAGPDDGKTEKVAFLGVETSPVGETLAVQLGLARDTGLVVNRLVKDSPAGAVLQEHDILTKLDDQILIDARQLSVLVRSRKAGDEVQLTVLRGGKENKFKVKLVEREMPVRQVFGFNLGELPGGARFFDLGGQPGMPGLQREELNDVFRLIGRERGNWVASPRVHVLRRAGGQGSTILDLTKGNFVFSDEEGSVELNAAAGKRELTVKNAKGDVLFQGPVNTEEERKQLPADVLARINKIEKFDLSVETGEDFEQGAATLGAPSKTRLPVIRALPAERWRAF